MLLIIYLCFNRGNRSSVTTMRLWVIKACLFRNQNLLLDSALHLVAIISFSSPIQALNLSHMRENVQHCMCVFMGYTWLKAQFYLWYKSWTHFDSVVSKSKTSYFRSFFEDVLSESRIFPVDFVTKLTKPSWFSEKINAELSIVTSFFYGGSSSTAASHLH